MYANFYALQGTSSYGDTAQPTKANSIMKFVDISLAVFTLFGLSAGVFRLSAHGWRDGLAGSRRQTPARLAIFPAPIASSAITSVKNVLTITSAKTVRR
jgi:hypothetical protein